MSQKVMIYLDYASTTKVDEKIFEELKGYWTEYYANPSSKHSLGRQVRDILTNNRRELAKILGVKESELIFCSCGTEANNLAILGIAYANSFRGKHIISTTVEHSSVLSPLAKLASDGFDITYLHVDTNGLISLEELKRVIKKDTILITILIVNNETGIVQPYNEISNIVRNLNDNIVIHYDFVAGFPKILQRFDQMDADLISISGHKLYAPKGTALLYIRSGIKIAPQILGGEQEFGLRAGTENFPGIVFLCKSIKKCIEESAKEQMRLNILQKYFEGKLKSQYGSNILICGENVLRIPYISNICFKNLKSKNIIRELSNYDIFVSSGAACKEDEGQPSHVVSAMGIPYNFANGSVRFSFGRYTTKEEIDYTLEKISEMVKNY